MKNQYVALSEVELSQVMTDDQYEPFVNEIPLSLLKDVKCPASPKYDAYNFLGLGGTKRLSDFKEDK